MKQRAFLAAVMQERHAVCTKHFLCCTLADALCSCSLLLPLLLQLESGTVDDELAALKKGMLTAGSSAAPVAALPEGRPVKDAIDMELEELRKKARE